MNSVADLVTEATIRGFATPSNFRLGQEIADNGGVIFTEFTPDKVAAHVNGLSTQSRNIILEASPSGLRWQCSCTGNKALFCKHLVAAGLETWRKSPRHH